MRSLKRPLALALAGGTVMALAPALLLSRGLRTQDIIDVIMIVAVWATLIGSYHLRRWARADLVYNRHTVNSNADVSATTSDQTRSVPTPLTGLTRRGWW